MFKCASCGHVFEEGTQDKWTEPSGEQWEGCPSCGGCFEEAKQCSHCDEWFFEDDELFDGLCEKCIYDHADIDTCFEIGNECRTEIGINGFLYSMFNVEQIEEILIRELKEANPSESQIAHFIEEDKDWFAEQLKEKGVI